MLLFSCKVNIFSLALGDVGGSVPPQREWCFNHLRKSSLVPPPHPAPSPFLLSYPVLSSLPLKLQSCPFFRDEKILSPFYGSRWCPADKAKGIGGYPSHSVVKSQFMARMF